MAMKTGTASSHTRWLAVGSIASIASAATTIIVLIRCHAATISNSVAGASRSATMVIGYLMWRDHAPFVDVHQRVRSARPTVNINEGFQQQLVRFEHDLKWVPPPSDASLARPGHAVGQDGDDEEGGE